MGVRLNRRTFDRRKRLIRQHGFGERSRWFLGIEAMGHGASRWR